MSEICVKCNKHKAVIKMQHGAYCEFCFVKYFEKKVYDTLTQYNLINKKEHIGVAVSGGKDSITVLYLIKRFAERHKLEKPIAVAIDEGIKGYREHTLKTLRQFCKNEKIKLKIFTYKMLYGKTLDAIIKEIKKRKLNIHACKICGVLRRQSLNKIAKNIKLNVLVTGHNMDDESQTILINFLKGNFELMQKQGITTKINNKAFVRRVKPLYFLSDKEVKLYTMLKGFNVKYNECPYAEESYRNDVEYFLNMFEAKYRGTKNAIVNTYIQLMQNQKESKINTAHTTFCKKCREPSTRKLCKACELLEKLYIS